MGSQHTLWAFLPTAVLVTITPGARTAMVMPQRAAVREERRGRPFRD
jgi:threonine/homoserine/homoserine lactone efflux protein